MGGGSDIGDRHYFGQANFFMPELLLKELCSFTVGVRKRDT